MRNQSVLFFVLWMAAAFLVGCADERHVVTTPVPPAPNNVVAR